MLKYEYKNSIAMTEEKVKVNVFRSNRIYLRRCVGCDDDAQNAVIIFFLIRIRKLGHCSQLVLLLPHFHFFFIISFSIFFSLTLFLSHTLATMATAVCRYIGTWLCYLPFATVATAIALAHLFLRLFLAMSCSAK